MAFINDSKTGGILNIELARPEAHNALNGEMMASLTKIFSAIKKDKSIRVVYLSGQGPSFCAGGDLNWMREPMKFTLAQNMKDTQKLSDMYEAIFRCPVPVIGYAHGNVMGGGVGLAAVCDILAAETEAKFCLSEVKLGLVPSIISPCVLRKIPEAEARLLMLTAEIFRAPYAHKVGLAHFVGPQTECLQFIKERVDLILKNAPEATQLTKELIVKVKAAQWPQARKLTVQTIAKKRTSKEGQEGMKAFFEKRKPSWQS